MAMQHHGVTLLGKLVQIPQSPILFNSRADLHCCKAWRGATRVTLAAYTTLHACNCSEAILQDLGSWCIPTPNAFDFRRWAEIAREGESELGTWAFPLFWCAILECLNAATQRPILTFPIPPRKASAR